MMMQCGCLILAMLLVAPASVSAAGSKRRAATEFMAREAEEDLLLMFDEALGLGHGHEIGSLEEVARRIEPTFVALPQNQNGKLLPQAVRYLINGYFMNHHGWVIKGIEQTRNITSEGQDLGDMLPVLKEKAPVYFNSVLAPRQEQGFGMKDVVVIVTMLEHLIIDEGLTTFRNAYMLNGFSTDDRLFEEDLDVVLQSNMVLFALGNRRGQSNATQHRLDMKWVARTIPSWNKREVLVRDMHRSFAFVQKRLSNPFVGQSFAFEDTSKIMVTLNQQFGQFHDTECKELKEGLGGMDPTATGRVPLGQFYAKKQIGYWHLVESSEYLETLGALDGSAPGHSQVIIPNYITAFSNCDGPSQFYSICCIHECEGLMNQLEVQIQAPVAPPALILELVTKLSSSTIDAPRNLSTALTRTLDQVAALHGGNVPLHGRLFAQWMHYAFPHECPYPHMSGTLTPLSPNEFRAQKGYSDDATEEERQQHMQAKAGHASDPMGMWTLDEELRAGVHRGAGRHRAASFIMGAVQILAGASILLGLLRSMAATVQNANGGSQKPKMPTEVKREFFV